MLDNILQWIKTIGVSDTTALKEDQALVEQLATPDEVPIELAIAMLLVDMAMIDSKFDSTEHSFISNLLKSTLQLSDSEVANLIKQSSLMVQFRGSHMFAVEIQKRISLEKRQELLQQLTKLLNADGNADKFETYLVKKFSDILGVA